MDKYRLARIAMMFLIPVACGAVARSAYAGEAISRAVTVVNGAPPIVFTEAISRAATVVRPLDPTVLTEAISRAATIVRPLDPPILTEAISRAVTMCDAAGLADIDSNGSLNSADITAFVGVLLGTNTDILQTERSDQNCDGIADGLDIQPFVDAMGP